MQKRTKIVCTVGPSTDKPGVLDEMIAAGMNVARFNFSHGSHMDHAKRIALVRAAAQKAGRPVALMLDTKGPEMRLGKFADGKVQLTAGQTFTLTGRDVPGTAEIVSVSYKNLAAEVAPGAKILLSDGLVELSVTSIDGEDIITSVLNSGEMSSNKRVAVPGFCINLPPVSEQDIADIEFGISQGMDFIAASFIQQASNVLAIRKILEDAGTYMGIIAKIENMPGVDNMDDILKVADGIMVARGDLGVEIPPEDVPLVQKLLIKRCNQAGKPVITATQMLESMIANPRPTRAEASDIANAILDGTDAIMLSGETASGLYPAEAVRTMARIALRTETDLNYGDLLRRKEAGDRSSTTAAISHASAHIAHELEAAAIITATETGYTARMVSKYRPETPVVAVTPNEKTARQVQLLWGVQAVLDKTPHNSDERMEGSIRAALAAGVIQAGDLVVVTAGAPAGIQGTTNMIQVHIAADVLQQGQGIGSGSAAGQVCVVTSPADLKDKFNAGDILVIGDIDETAAAYAVKAGAIITEEGGLSSSAAIIGLSYNIPVIVGAAGAVQTLKDGLTVTVDAGRGMVFRGQANAR